MHYTASDSEPKLDLGRKSGVRGYQTVGRYIRRARKFILHNVLHADDTPHAIALGVGIAMVVAFLPLVGFQTAIAIGLAALFRANKAVCIPIVWITNPLTLVPIYGGCLALGRSILSSPSQEQDAAAIARFEHHEQTFRIFELQFWTDLFQFLVSLGIELWLGCAIVGVTFGVISYIVAHRGVLIYRERRRLRVLRRNLFRAHAKKSKLAGHDSAA